MIDPRCPDKAASSVSPDIIIRFLIISAITETDKIRKMEHFDQVNEPLAFGLELIPGSDLVAVRYKKCASLFDLDGDILRSWSTDGKFTSMSSLDPDHLVLCDTNGTLFVENLTRGGQGQRLALFEEALQLRHGWCALTPVEPETPGGGRVMVAATRNSCQLLDLRCDLRVEGKTPLLDTFCDPFRGIPADPIGGMDAAGGRVYVATASRIGLLDTRMGAKNKDDFVLEWKRFNNNRVGDDFPPSGLAVKTIDTVDYAVAFDPEGSLDIAALDRVVSPAVMRGPNPGRLNGRSGLLQSFVDNDEIGWNLRSPWTGLRIYGSESNTVHLLGLNACGTIFGCRLRKCDDDLEGQPGTLWPKSDFNDKESESEIRRRLKKWTKDYEKKRFVKSAMFHRVHQRTSGIPFPPLPSAKVEYKIIKGRNKTLKTVARPKRPPNRASIIDKRWYKDIYR